MMRPHHPVKDVGRREAGGILFPRNFCDRFYASENVVLPLEIVRNLSHLLPVNTVSFNDGGDMLLSSAKDFHVTLWDWQLGQEKISFHEEHERSVFDAKFMPYSNDRTIITCVADGWFRRASIGDGDIVETSLLHHEGRILQLCMKPGNFEIFYTWGRDGLVQCFDLRTGAATELFTCRIYSTRETIHLTSISIDPRNHDHLAVGGNDVYARIYDLRRSLGDRVRLIDHICPPHLIGDKEVGGITGLTFSEQSELLVSYHNEHMYLFPRLYSSLNVISETLVYEGHRNFGGINTTNKSVSFFGGKSEYVVSGSDCGRIFIWRKKDKRLIRVMQTDRRGTTYGLIVNPIACHPHVPVLACCGDKTDIQVLTLTATERATLPENIELIFFTLEIMFTTLFPFIDLFCFVCPAFDLRSPCLVWRRLW